MAAVQARLRSRDVSISVGLAELRAGDDLDALISRADSALYAGRARRRGRPAAASEGLV